MGEHAFRVALLDDDAVVFAAQAHVDAVDAADDRRAAADALAAHAGDRSGFVGHFDIHRVGVLARLVGSGHEGELEPGFFRQVEGLANAQIVGGHAKQAGHEGLVGAVSSVGVRETAVEREGCLAWFACQKAAAHERDAQCACGVAA